MPPPSTCTCVTPVAASYVSSENTSEHGAVDGDVVVSITTARTTVLARAAPADAYGSFTFEICPVVSVNAVVVPITSPLAL